MIGVYQCLKPACLCIDTYKGRNALTRAYKSLSPRFIDVNNDNIGLCVADKRRVYLAFRGCKDLDELMFCVETKMTKPFLNKDMMVNKAVWQKYEEVHENVKDILDSNSDVEEVIFTGHSLGGAISQVAALMCGNKNTMCITFGSPHVGNEAYKRECDARIPSNARVVVQQDVVPKIRFNNDLVHAGVEINYNSMSTSPFPVSVYDHHSCMNYLRCLVESL